MSTEDKFNNNSDHDDFEATYLSEIELDIEEERESLNVELDQLSSDRSNLKSSLNNKLVLYPDGCFPISEYSSFHDEHWQFLDENDLAENKFIRFKDNNSKKTFLKKIILYHYIPTFNPQGTIKSFQTTLAYYSIINLLDKFLFEPNHIKSFPEDINSISIRMLNKSLDEAKESEYFSHYKNLYQVIGFWFLLSDNNLIPEEYRLHINYSKVINTTRQKDVIKVTTCHTTPYSPFSHNEFESLINYALFWTETAIPYIIKAIDYATELKIPTLSSQQLTRKIPDKKLEKLFNTEVDGMKIIGFSKREKVDKRYGSTYTTYFTNHKVRVAVDNVRNAIFIFVALLTGLRRRELASLKFEDFVQLSNGECFVNITRFKTSQDPNYEGENDILPIPNYLYENITNLGEMREYIGNKGEGYIFISSKSRKKLNSINTSPISTLIKEISNFLNLDNLHAHRFRKTIAEILISQDETNVDLIRELFGHKSFTMVLRYIARNPNIVRSISRIMEHHHINEFTEAIEAINEGHYSGHAFERLARQISNRPSAFQGASLKITIREYVLAMLQANEPIFIHRTPMDTFCLSVPLIGGNDLTPCVEKSKNTIGKVTPDPSNCQYDKCSKAGITTKAKKGIEENIIFYSNILEQDEIDLPAHSKKQISQRVQREKVHLDNLNRNRTPLAEQVNIEKRGSSR